MAADPKMQADAAAWIEAVTGMSLGGDFAAPLQDGVILCELVNKIKPGSVAKINKPATMPFKKLENITNSIKAMRALGIREFELFSTPDLAEEKNLNAVVIGITALGRWCQKNMPDAPFPKLGVKEADKTERAFTEEQLRKGAAAVSVLNLGSSDMGKKACEAVLEGKGFSLEGGAVGGAGAL